MGADVLMAEFFWICIFSLTAKAALSISYDDEDLNPFHCRIMGLIGLVYCLLIDKSLFSYAFQPIQLALCGTLAIITVIMLLVHASEYDAAKEEDEAALSAKNNPKSRGASSRNKLSRRRRALLGRRD